MFLYLAMSPFVVFFERLVLLFGYMILMALMETIGYSWS